MIDKKQSQNEKNFVAASNISQFLLKKGSSGTSLTNPGKAQGYEMMQQRDEYAYRIDLHNMNMKTVQNPAGVHTSNTLESEQN